MSVKIRKKTSYVWKKTIFWILVQVLVNLAKYFGSTFDNSVITFDEVVKATKTFSTKAIPTKTIATKAVPTTTVITNFMSYSPFY